ncbi:MULTISPECIES: hypothetical protein [Streptomyces]|uniref:DUF3558 domain-containing protein n=2 Tax=Streptomyces TaxID=1883 RepID=A0A117IUK9_9ACTN|nr:MULTISPECIES: hypothetical protein [Streptomyces]KUH35765.1 hypothetical protein ATE80_27345 [Streptomyces kanasensis]UUS32745.1 hypothetical protein NRO40_19270 [Streptomyces changanensis]
MISDLELLDDDGEPVRGPDPGARAPGSGAAGPYTGASAPRAGAAGPYAGGGGGVGGPPSGGPGGGPRVPAGDAPAAGVRDPRGRPWPWALGGALVASVVWGGGLAVHQALDRGPDLGGYRATDGLCAEAPLSSLVAAYGKRGATTSDDSTRHPALDRAYCSVQLGEQPTTYEVTIRYELHRQVDPGAEFDAKERQSLLDEGPEPQPVVGLGEQAYFGDGASYADLVVLDGHTVLGLSVSLVHEYDLDGEDHESPDEQEVPALTDVKGPMVEDMRKLMEVLRGAPPEGIQPSSVPTPGAD